MEYFDRIRYEKINESMQEICTPPMYEKAWYEMKIIQIEFIISKVISMQSR
jgi:hypothetical protein